MSVKEANKRMQALKKVKDENHQKRLGDCFHKQHFWKLYDHLKSN